MFCEVEEHNKVVAGLVKGLTQKNPKTVSGCVESIKNCLRVFGPEVIKISPLANDVSPLLSHRDPIVRDEVGKLIVEGSRYIFNANLSVIAEEVKINLLSK